jgi:hypothetical protein
MAEEIQQPEEGKAEKHQMVIVIVRLNGSDQH